jgi:hypothetical protein
MNNEDATQALARQADDIAGRVSGPDREKMLLSGWMAHHARWFSAVARACGLDVANKLNAAAVHETGRVEARRAIKLLGIATPSDLQACVITQEAMGKLLAPGLVDYELTTDADSVRFDVRRCFAYENVTKAGIASQYRCGIFPRLEGWWDVFNVRYELTPAPGPCAMAAGKPCAYTIRVVDDAPPA